MAKKARNYLCTLNAPWIELADVKAIDDYFGGKIGGPVRYVLGQREKGSDSERSHLQFFVNTNQPVTVKTIAGVFPGCHAEHASRPAGAMHYVRKPCRNLDCKEEYCRTERKRDGTPNDLPFEYGDKPRQGQRVDLWPAPELRDAVWRKRSWQDIMLDDDLLEQWNKRPTQVRTLWESKPAEVFTDLDEKDLRPWQRELYDEVRGEPDRRKVIWYVDEKGGAGKSTMAGFLESKLDAFVVQDGSRLADIARAYDKSKSGIIVFDIARSHVDDLPYDQMEKFKDGRIFSPKYDSRILRFKRPHVIVFSNEYPNSSRLSADRWEDPIRDLGKRAERERVRVALGQDLDDTDTDRE